MSEALPVAAAAAAPENVLCSICANEEGTYRSVPCGCNIYCKHCAMKMATGGKCKSCHELFVSMKCVKNDTADMNSDGIDLIIDKTPEEIPKGFCSVCAKEQGTYRSVPCGCNVYCRKCAMKMATGGKCKACHELFVSMKCV